MERRYQRIEVVGPYKKSSFEKTQQSYTGTKPRSLRNCLEAR